MGPSHPPAAPTAKPPPLPRTSSPAGFPPRSPGRIGSRNVLLRPPAANPRPPVRPGTGSGVGVVTSSGVAPNRIRRSADGRDLGRAVRGHPGPARSPDGSPAPSPPRCHRAATRGREAVGYARGARQPEECTALPAAARRKPEPHTGEQLELELVGGSAVPRPARWRGPARAPGPAEATPPAVPPEPGPAAVAPSTAVRRGPGRPREVPAALALPPGLGARGGRRRGTPAPR